MSEREPRGYITPEDEMRDAGFMRPETTPLVEALIEGHYSLTCGSYQCDHAHASYPHALATPTDPSEA